jgi:acetyl esterase/lipase
LAILPIFKARAKHPYLSHTGRASKAEKQPTGPGPEGCDENGPAAALQATTEQLKGLPPAMVQTAVNDVLRDEGEAYARKLDEAGVDVTAVRYEGLIHDYGLLNALSEVPAVRDAFHQAAEMLGKHLK